MSESEPMQPLRSLGGRAPAAELRDDLLLVDGLSDIGRRELGGLVGACLGENVPASVDAQVAGFAGRHERAPKDVSRLVRALRFVLRQSSMFDVEREVLVADMQALCGPESGAADWLGDVFEQAKARVRQETRELSLLDHGRVVEGVDWRIDRAEASNRGLGLRTVSVSLTLRIKDAQQSQRETFVLPLDAVEDLRRALETVTALLRG